MEILLGIIAILIVVVICALAWIYRLLETMKKQKEADRKAKLRPAHDPREAKKIHLMLENPDVEAFYDMLVELVIGMESRGEVFHNFTQVQNIHLHRAMLVFKVDYPYVKIHYNVDIDYENEWNFKIRIDYDQRDREKYDSQ